MRILLIVSLLLFVVACCIPSMEFTGKPEGNTIMTGATVLANGWAGLFSGVFGWYANPLWLLGLILAFIGKPKLGAASAVLAIAIACTTFSTFGKSIGTDEAGQNYIKLVRLLPGCYVWLASLAVVPVCLFFKGK